MNKLLRKIVPKNLRKIIKPSYTYLINHINKSRLRSLTQSKTIFLVGSPEHDNLGDHAISYAMYQFLKNNFPEFSIYEIPTMQFIYYCQAMKSVIKEQDIIVMNGGGNLGNQYIEEEMLRREVIKNFPNNKIIIFPQTIYFTKDEKGKKEFEKSKAIYSNHSMLTIVAREVISYDILKCHFQRNNILLTPDIVFYLNLTDDKIARGGALICLREDVEGVISKEDIKKIKIMFTENYGGITVTDTVVYKRVLFKDREHELIKKWNQFKKAEVVITDRLHGLIFAAITSTPCIVLSNYNYKIKGTYEWLENLDYIIFDDDIKNVNSHIQTLKSRRNKPEYTITHQDIIKYYKQILKEINVSADEE